MLRRVCLVVVVMFAGCVLLSGCSGGDEKPKEIPVQKGRVPVDPNAKK